MKALFFLTGLALAAVLGHTVEPYLRPYLVGCLATANVPKTSPPPPSPGFTAEIDLSSIPSDQLPKEVSLLEALTFTDQSTGITMTIQAGATAGLVRIENNQAVIRPSHTAYSVTVPVSHTDLAKRLLTRPATPPPAPVPPPPVAASSAIPEPTAPAAPMPAPSEDDTADSPADPDPDSPAPSKGDVVRIMRKSLDRREIKEFEVHDVKSWKAEPEETLEGTTFQVGSITYEQNSVFGLHIVTAKAYILDGKVKRWVWPKSGLVIQ